MLFVQVPYEEAADTRTFDEPDRHGHVRMYSPEEFCHQLELVGFETERLNFRRQFPQLRLDQPDVFGRTEGRRRRCVEDVRLRTARLGRGAVRRAGGTTTTVSRPRPDRSRPTRRPEDRPLLRRLTSMPTAGNEPSAAAVLVPVKAFRQAKVRLAPALRPERANLARGWPTGRRGRGAAARLRWCATTTRCRAWAARHGRRGRVVPGPGPQRGRGRRGGRPRRRRASTRWSSPTPTCPLASRPGLGGRRSPGVTLVPDRRDDGTNVACVPDGRRLPVRLRRRVVRAATGPRPPASASPLRVVADPALGWDVDVPDDLDLAADPTADDHRGGRRPLSVRDLPAPADGAGHRRPPRRHRVRLRRHPGQVGGRGLRGATCSCAPTGRRARGTRRRTWPSWWPLRQAEQRAAAAALGATGEVVFLGWLDGELEAGPAPALGGRLLDPPAAARRGARPRPVEALPAPPRPPPRRVPRRRRHGGGPRPALLPRAGHRPPPPVGAAAVRGRRARPRRGRRPGSPDPSSPPSSRTRSQFRSTMEIVTADEGAEP